MLTVRNNLRQDVCADHVRFGRTYEGLLEGAPEYRPPEHWYASVQRVVSEGKWQPKPHVIPPTLLPAQTPEPDWAEEWHGRVPQFYVSIRFTCWTPISNPEEEDGSQCHVIYFFEDPEMLYWRLADLVEKVAESFIWEEVAEDFRI